jgi:hypothetical protein
VARILAIEIFDDDAGLRDGAIRGVVAQHRNLPIGHSFSSAARSVALERSTETGVNGVSFSYRATNAFRQNDDRGWKLSLRDMTPSFGW